MAKKKKQPNNRTTKKSGAPEEQKSTDQESMDLTQPALAERDLPQGDTKDSTSEVTVTPDQKSSKAPVNRPWLHWVLLGVVCASIYFNQLAAYSLIDPGETINSESARQMLLHHNLLTPYYNYHIDFASFVLPSWLVLAGYKLINIGALAARLPFAILVSVLIAATYLTTKRLVHSKAAFYAALITAAAPLLVLSTRTDTTSLTFAVALDLTVFATALAIFARVKLIAILLWLALATAVLTHGPVSLLLYLIPFVLFCLASKVKAKQLLHWLTRMALVPGLLLLIAINAFYFTQVPPVYITGLMHYPNYLGFTRIGHNKYDWLYYLPVLAYGLAPWFLLLPQALKNHFFVPLNESWFGGRLNFKSSYRPYDKDRVRPVVADDAELSAIDVERLSLFWFTTFALSYLLIFSFYKVQSDCFILPAIAPLAISLGVIAERLASPWQRQFDETADPLKWDRFWLQCIFGLVCAITLGVAAFISWAAFLPAAGTSPRPDWLMLGCTAGLLSIAAIQIQAIKDKNWPKSLPVSLLSMVMIVALSLPILLRYYTDKTEDDFVKIALQIKDAPYDVILLGPMRPSINTYLDRRVACIDSMSQIIAAPAKTKERHRVLLVTNFKASELANQSKVPLVKLMEEGAWTCYGLSDISIQDK